MNCAVVSILARLNSCFIISLFFADQLALLINFILLPLIVDLLSFVVFLLSLLCLLLVGSERWKVSE